MMMASRYRTAYCTFSYRSLQAVQSRQYRLVEHLDQGAFGSWSCAHLTAHLAVPCLILLSIYGGAF